jgi:hypothetical protein
VAIGIGIGALILLAGALVTLLFWISDDRDRLRTENELLRKQLANREERT